MCSNKFSLLDGGVLVTISRRSLRKPFMAPHSRTRECCIGNVPCREQFALKQGPKSCVQGVSSQENVYLFHHSITIQSTSLAISPVPRVICTHSVHVERIRALIHAGVRHLLADHTLVRPVESPSLTECFPSLVRLRNYAGHSMWQAGAPPCRHGVATNRFLKNSPGPLQRCMVHICPRLDVLSDLE